LGLEPPARLAGPSGRLPRPRGDPLAAGSEVTEEMVHAASHELAAVLGKRIAQSGS
jgi:hypothetical protein